MKRVFQLFSVLILSLIVFTACNDNKTGDVQGADDDKVVIAVTATPHEEIINHLQPQFEEEGLEVETVVFEDYAIFNTALAEGEVDANYFQHLPYFEDFISQHELDLVSLGPVHLEPLGFYSTKVNSLEELEDGAEILVPNDDTNNGRALLLLQDYGLITLKDPEALGQTEKDIEENPKNLVITPVDAASIAKTYEDVDGAVINSNFAILEGLDPLDDSIVLENDVDNPYANIVAVRKGEENFSKFERLMKVLQSEETAQFLEEKYRGSVIPSSE